MMNRDRRSTSSDILIDIIAYTDTLRKTITGLLIFKIKCIYFTMLRKNNKQVQ